MTASPGVTEISGAEELKRYRLQQPTNQGVSFGSISASGPNGAVIHYRLVVGIVVKTRHCS